MERVNLIVDLQYGSTGKGLIAGWLATRDRPDTIFTAWAANAGHTYIDARGRKFVHTMLANGIVSDNLRRIMIGPGSVIDPYNLWDEINAAKVLGVLDTGRTRIMIHPHAAVIAQIHRDEEAGPMTKIGSTKKGVGAAMIQRIRRDPGNINTANTALRGHPVDQFVVSMEEWMSGVGLARNVLIEGAQGVGLSMYHGFYPYVTSRDVSTLQILADCGIPYEDVRYTLLNVIGTMRTYPIRVANRFDEKTGEKVGWSGPCYPDQQEISWDSLGLTAELTTVTKLPRRIFTFSNQQARDTCRIAGCNEIFLNFINYLPSAEAALAFVERVESAAKVQVRWIGVGATDGDVAQLSTFNATDTIRRCFKSSLPVKDAP